MHGKKNKNRNIRLKPSLTKKRTELLRNATERIENGNTQGMQFLYADFNGNIKIRLKKFTERDMFTLSIVLNT